MSTPTIDRPMEQKRLEASAVVASRVSHLHLAGVEQRITKRITKRDLLIVAGFAVALALVVLWFRAQHERDQQSLSDQRTANKGTIQMFSDQLREQQGMIIAQQKESREEFALIGQLRHKLIKLGVNPKSIPSAPAIPVVAPVSLGLGDDQGVTGTSNTSGVTAAGGAGRALPSPSRPVAPNPSPTSSAGRPNPSPTPTHAPKPTPKPTSTPLIDIPSIRVGVIQLPAIKVG